MKKIIDSYLVFLSENNSDTIKKTDKLKEKYKEKKEKIKKDKTVPEKIKDISMAAYRSISDELSDSTAKKISKQMKKIRVKNISDKIRPTGIKPKTTLLATASAIASFIIYMSYKNHKIDKERLIKSCFDKKGKEKILCIKKHNKDALLLRINFLRKSIFKCKYSDDPIKCKAKIDSEILKIEQKIKDIGSEIASGI